MSTIVKFKNKDIFIIINKLINKNILSKLHILYSNISNVNKNINIIINSSIDNFKPIHNKYSKFTFVYSFNNIKYSQLIKIKEIMNKCKKIIFHN